MIQEGLGPSWPEPVRKALKLFRQGHLIEKPPLFWGTDLRHPIYKTTVELAAEVDEAERGEDFVAVEDDDRPAYGIITTQTCDIAEERDDPQKPWLSVAPVYALPAGHALLGRDFIFKLDRPAAEGEVLVADLRIEVPLEKSVMADREPIEAFDTEARAVEFGRDLAFRRGRPALATVVHQIVGAQIEKIRKTSDAQRNLCRRVRKETRRVMLAIEEGERLDPRAIKLYMVTNGPASDDARRLMEELWWSAARLVAEEKGLTLHPTGWINAKSADLELLDDLIELRSPF